MMLVGFAVLLSLNFIKLTTKLETLTLQFFLKTLPQMKGVMVRKRYYYFRLSTLKYVYIYIFTNGLLNFFSQK